MYLVGASSALSPGILARSPVGGSTQRLPADVDPAAAAWSLTRKIRRVTPVVVLAFAATSCSDLDDRSLQTPEMEGTQAVRLADDNPFSSASPLQFEYPRFDAIEPRHFLPAFEAGIAEQLAEVASIAQRTDEPTVENTLLPLEQSGRLLERVERVFLGLVAAHTSEALQAIQRQIEPRLSAHVDDVLLNEKLFQRVASQYEQRSSLSADPQTLRLIEKKYQTFVRAGAALGAAEKTRLRAINTELAELVTRFEQNVLAEGNALAVIVDSPAELTGLSSAQINAAAGRAEGRGLKGRYAIPLVNTTQQPSMAVLEERSLRRRLLEASQSRGSRGGEYDNREIVSRVARLRAERAQLLGYATHADYVLDEQTAGSVASVNEHLAALLPPAVANARREAAELQAAIAASGGTFDLAAWDWDYYANGLRSARHAFDDAALKPYFELDRVLKNGVFFAAGQLYGVTFAERFDLPVYEPSVRVFEVFDHDGAALALFVLDPYARPSKRGGAWTFPYVARSRLLGTKAIVLNMANVARPPEGEPTLLTLVEVTTIFHEFGHALHSMFADVAYPSLMAVPRDFVEFPSQLNEMWALWPEVLRNYAVHHVTGEPLPAELLERLRISQAFNQGYETTSYLAAAIADQALHQLTPDEVPSANELMSFETEALAAAGVALEVVPPRYRYPYFLHIVSGPYSAAYYSYIWSQVLDADAAEWFDENGGLTRANGQRFRDTLLSRGASEDPLALYRGFRGRDAELRPLLERRGLLSAQIEQPSSQRPPSRGR